MNLEKTHWTMNTDLQKVFDLILDTSIEHKVKENDMPKTIYIISDMEFDAATSDNKKTNFKIIKQKYKEAGYEIKGLWIAGLQRKITIDNAMFPLKLMSSLVKSRSIIKQFKPNVVIGTGGFASGPLLQMANSAGIPTVIQEQNSYPGITNKLLAKKASKICVAYEGLESFFPKEKIILTGNPVRKEVWNIQNKKNQALDFFKLKTEMPVVLVVGGSLGARTINQAIDACATSITSEGIQILWQTGKSYTEKTHAQNELISQHIFIKEMDLAYAAADIIISRAGAMSISELCLIGKPTILIPSPNVSEDHQTKNAMALVNKNAALIVKDSEAVQQLPNEILSLLKNKERQGQLSSEISKLGKGKADQQIAEIIFEVIQQRKK
jgi:UDP-N-acetylglucosamine--N-acetylmuramyl-(pentapeptide) pyrophosphoryl-undecaprenol N-acetylglucosamine transferase